MHHSNIDIHITELLPPAALNFCELVVIVRVIANSFWFLVLCCTIHGRKSFCVGLVPERPQRAFSQPTSAGKTLASTYAGAGSVVVHKP